MNRQSAALCWRERDGDLEILMITSLDTGRWIIPKGWPMEGKMPHEVALQEAWEEAGVKGEADPCVIGEFSYRKVKRGASIDILASVYSVEVEGMASKFPERGLRKIAWVSPEKAAEKLKDAGLSDLVKQFAEARQRLPAFDI